MNFIIETLRLGLTNLALHKLRSLLTALGIILGVAAVIVMVAIGEGNKQVALAKIRQLGARNIIVRSVKPAEQQTAGEAKSRLLIYGLKRVDVERLRVLEERGLVKRLVPLKRVGATVSRPGREVPSATAMGTLPALLNVTSINVAPRGRYLTDEDERQVRPVAVIGSAIARQLFQLEDPLGGTIFIDDQSFRVVGVLEPVGLAGGAGSALVGRDLNFDVHIPMATARARFGDRIIKRQSGQFNATQLEFSEVYLEAPDTETVLPVAEQVRAIIAREHEGEGDVQITVPLELLEQERSQRIMMDTLLVAIAAISLLVGGIGIMNIMLATVTERTREIGIRRAVGATRSHITVQFLAETTVLSGVGGLLGVGVGLLGSWGLGYIHESIPGIELPQVRSWAIGVSFCVATAVGIIFGLYPAIKAAQQDPIVALRHD